MINHENVEIIIFIFAVQVGLTEAYHYLSSWLAWLLQSVSLCPELAQP